MDKILYCSIRLFSLLPLWAIQSLGWLVGSGLYFFPTSVKRITFLNIKKCFPKLSKQQLQQLTQKSLIHTVITAVEMPKIFMQKSDKMFSSIKSIKGIDKAILDYQSGNPILFVGPHFGCWEVAGLHVSSRFPVHTLYTAPKSQALDLIVKRARARSGAIMSEANKKGVMAMFKALKNKECVAILADQVPENSGGLYVPFFNVPALTMTLAAKMYEKCQPKVYVTYGVRRGIGQGYDIHYISLDNYLNDFNQSNQLSKEQVFTYALNKSFESIILSFPEQYEWSYKRFKWQPMCMNDPYTKTE